MVSDSNMISCYSVSKSKQQWLHGEIANWQAEGIITPELADVLRSRYGVDDRAKGTGSRWALSVFSIIGAALIGLGAILLVAHNWEWLSHGMRAALAIGMVLGSQGFVWWTMRRGASVAWTEATAFLLTLCVGAALAIVGQTYHFPSDLGRFIAVWMVLAIPMLFLTNAIGVATFYQLGFVVWSTTDLAGGLSGSLMGLALGLIPLVYAVTRPVSGLRAYLFYWSLCLGLPLAFILQHGSESLPYGTVLALSLYAALYAISYALAETMPRVAGQAAHGVGALGLVVVTLALGVQEPWERSLRFDSFMGEAAFMATALAAWSAYNSRRFVTTRQWHRALLMLLPLVFVALVYISTQRPWIGAVGFSLVGGAIALGALFNALDRQALARANLCLLILASVIAIRFIDTELSFLWRGLGFIGVGIAFVTTNLWMLRKRVRRAA